MPETSCTKLKDLYKYIGIADEGIPDLAIGELVWSKRGVLRLRLKIDLPFNELSSLTSAVLSGLESRLGEFFGIKHCSVELHWQNPPAPDEAGALLAKWREWLADTIKRTDTKLATAFATSDYKFINGVAEFELLPIHRDYFNNHTLCTIQALAHIKTGINWNFRLKEIDLSVITRQMDEEYNSLLKVIPPAENDGETANAATREIPKSFKPAFRKVDGLVFGKWNTNIPQIELKDITSESGVATITGYMAGYEQRMISNNQRALIKFNVQDTTAALACVCFLRTDHPEQIQALADLNKKYASFQVEVGYDAKFTKDIQGMVTAARLADPPAGRSDNAPEKRVELHCHTKMSAKDAVSNPADVVKLAAQFGHEAVAVTDHGVVQGFPEAFEAAKAMAKAGKPIKLILGMEGYIIPDGEAVVYGLNLPRGENAEVDYNEGNSCPLAYVALDVETTGLDPVKERVIEIGAAKFVRNSSGEYEVSETFHRMLNPEVKLPEFIMKLTGITQAEVDSGIKPLQAVQDLIDFVGDLPVCAHNAMFDIGFIRAEGFRTPNINDPKLKFNPITIDTLRLSVLFWPSLSNHKLDTVCNFLQIDLAHHHRAVDDAIACGQIFARACQIDSELTLTSLNQRSGLLRPEEITDKEHKPNHIIFLVRNLLGLYNLYRLVSISHTQYFHKRPRIPKHLLTYFRHGIIVGAACEAGEVFRHVRNLYESNGCDFELTKGKLNTPASKKLARYYDYLEIQPLTNNLFLTRRQQNPLNDKDLINLNLLVIHLAELTKMRVVATCDSHFLNKEDGIFRHILLTNIGYDVNERQPELYFRNTDEMLAEFTYLSPDKAKEFCVTNPRYFASLVEPSIRPFPDGTFPPLIASADKDIETMTYRRASELYEYQGKLPEIVSKRIEKELNSIIKNGFAIMYYIAHKLVKKSNDDGYIVGSRGSVGSSFVATLCGITEVNPLCPHYRCPHCRYSRFDESGKFGSGFDLPPEKCPDCGEMMIRDGQDIPFETFLGFNGDKQPDIDLNFSGVYQPHAHKYIQEMFGIAHTYRAGTIGCFAEKNALGMVRKYLEDTGEVINRAGQQRLAAGMDGVKRTTGQHPGGIVVIPKEREVFDFTPIQYPADKLDSVMTTTHFDFNSLHDTILKLDILGHDDPTMLKVLSDMTKIKVTDIPIPDEKVMRMFVSTEPLGIPDGTSPADSATLGLPEMGTFMARGMIKETKPSRFYDLVQLMGLSHGTDVWKGNAQDLIHQGICTINEVIGCRDGIMTRLIYYGLPAKSSFDIMEKVRKGKGLSEEHEALMREHNVPDWYIDSCKKIKYMFPKAHAAAYAISALRIAWFKVYYPEAYYSAYFTVRADEFDSDILCVDANTLQNNKRSLRLAFSQNDGKEKDKNLYYIAEIVEEMNLRGIKFLPIDIYDSDPVNFLPEGKGFVRPPLNALPSISSAIAMSIAAERDKGLFKNQSELMQRAKIGETALGVLRDHNCLRDMPTSAQLDLFSLSMG